MCHNKSLSHTPRFPTSLSPRRRSLTAGSGCVCAVVPAATATLPRRSPLELRLTEPRKNVIDSRRGELGDTDLALYFDNPTIYVFLMC
eukprot:2578730-Pleurochrysis_carterae.AAC.1